MPSNYKANDPYVNEQVDLDDILVTDAWLVDQFVGGTLFGWGAGDYGALGNSVPGINYPSPIQIGSLTNWKQVATSLNTNHTAAIKTDGTLWTWGYNNFGQLGRGNTINYSSPVQVGSMTNWKQVVLGYHHTIALKTDGTLWSWGYNINGQLGNGTTAYYSSPVQVGALTNWKQLSVTSYINTAAIKTDGTLWTWGNNTYGSLGNGTTIHYSSPVQVGSLTNWKQVACGNLNTAAIKTDGTLWTWGDSYYGTLGNGTNLQYSSPIQIGSLANWKQVSCGYLVAAIKTDGTLWTWGNNTYGSLGNGTTIHYSSPVQVGSLTNWKQVFPGKINPAAIKTDGTLWAWGYNGFGNLGNGTSLSYSSPIQIGSLTNWKQVSTGWNTAAITFRDLG